MGTGRERIQLKSNKGTVLAYETNEIYLKEEQVCFCILQNDKQITIANIHIST